MISYLWERLLAVLERSPYWRRAEPFVLAAFFYVGISVVTYQYIEWRYQLALSLPLFLASYAFKQISVVFWALAAGVALVTYRDRATRSPATRRGLLAAKGLAILLVAAVALFAWKRLTPVTDVSSIRVMFAPSEEFGRADTAVAGAAGEDRPIRIDDLKEPLVYIVFELNRLQKTWHFDVDPVNFRRDMVPAAAELSCADDPVSALCLAEAHHRTERAKDPSFPPLILITPAPLDSASNRYTFWAHRGAASVITTRDWQGYAVPSLYEYLAYSFILQGMLIHLDAYCGGLPLRPSESGGIVNGNAFEYQPLRGGMRALVLSGHLGPDDERLLLNCFGPDYFRVASELLRLDWLRAAPVRANLRAIYGIEIMGVAVPQ